MCNAYGRESCFPSKGAPSPLKPRNLTLASKRIESLGANPTDPKRSETLIGGLAAVAASGNGPCTSSHHRPPTFAFRLFLAETQSFSPSTSPSLASPHAWVWPGEGEKEGTRRVP